MAHAPSPTISFVDALWPASFLGSDKSLDLGLVPFLRGNILEPALAMALAPRGAAMVRRLEA
jgi:hypothetical protein